MSCEPEWLDAAPRYDAAGLAAVLPSVIASLGVPRWNPGPIPLPPARHAIVVLADGLGHDLLARRSGHAPFLRTLLPTAHRLTAGFPTTTATSMATFGTGLAPGSHGLLGYEVLDPDTDLLVNELSWENGPDPWRWQPHRTVLERVDAAGLSVTRVGPAYFEGSGLTNATLRGGRFVAAIGLSDRVDVALAAVRAASRSLVILYWGDLDKVGHQHGCQSWQWGDQLEAVDAAVSRLAAAATRDTAVYVTADHGMVDVPHAARIDLADEPGLAAGIRHVGGEARARHLYCQAGAADDVVAVWRQRLGDQAVVLSRSDAVDRRWFGAVEERVLPRVGDAVVVMAPGTAVVDSRRERPQLLALLGLHGSLTRAEVDVPLLSVPAERGG
ncbi:MAG TPA: nucleotide pyrophosphatase/phosphodiesterase family protein [Dermatophilaceae bacterium]|nr:nucleotide pyrophosphatase/phosphodiesterase family protein [Dermatophilaceae bacterium]